LPTIDALQLKKPKRINVDPEPNAIAGAIKQLFAKPAQSTAGAKALRP
jgi:hypothetical protein